MEQCTEQQGAWNVPPRSLFVSTFSPFPSRLSVSTSRPSFSHTFSLVPGRGALLFLPLHWQPWLRIDLKKTRVTERLEILLAAVRATGNSVNNKSAGRQRRLAVTTHRVSLFVPWFCAFTEPELLVPVESEFRCYAPSNRGTSVRLITSRLFEHARLDIDFSEKKSDTILRYLK